LDESVGNHESERFDRDFGNEARTKNGAGVHHLLIPTH
jgi:hypothetical protein